MMSNNTFKSTCVALASIIVIISCDNADSNRSNIIYIKQGSYCFAPPKSWRRYCCGDAPEIMRDQVYYDRSNDDEYEVFSIGPIKNPNSRVFVEALEKQTETISTDGNYTYYEYGWKSQEGDSVQYTRVINYQDKWFGIGYSAKNLNVKIGKTLADSEIPDEIKRAISSFRVADSIPKRNAR